MPEELNATLTISDGKTQKTIQITGQKDNSSSLVVGQGLYAYYKFDGDFNDATEMPLMDSEIILRLLLKE